MVIKKFMHFYAYQMATMTSCVVGITVMSPSMQGWYKGVSKPWFGPSDTVLTAVWVVLHVLLGIIGFLLWHNGREESSTKKTLRLYYLQLILTLGWVLLFFGLKDLLLAFIERLFLWTVLLLLIMDLRKISKFVTAFYAVYILWTTYLLAFNLSVFLLNR